ncbi:MFS monocarboxylate transporter [Cordyceps fumosorosea ARSEF 2679]|uniref:MFS monocarboxylate transporter n=1 Tax=Cordyceps fumosorosea (strain ARSEF 2679) TaxID=1081104 RepID=A0A167S9M8_CORFA|nr:MFS monocarboxylate transporter [Cordyceps fumosorosea ARSEF 2679]OAA59400.1 MFS monocarboxylate transporter [Cordyceps fumosorosea ARSEF 2679]
MHFFGTLVAIAQCHDHMLTDHGILRQPALLIVDEVGRLTEAHALIGEQFGPIVATAGTRFEYYVDGHKFEFRSVVSAQLEKSFLARAAALDGIDARLTMSPRVRIGRRVSMQALATEAVQEWFARHSASGKNSLFVNLSSEEQQQGTSKTNPTSAYFVNTGSIRKGHVLILVAYGSQKMQVLRCLKKISAHEVDKSRISVRTIDDSPSHEVEIAIVDLVRSDGIGFLAEPARLKVAATRAQLGTIWVGCRELCKRRDN